MRNQKNIIQIRRGKQILDYIKVSAFINSEPINVDMDLKKDSLLEISMFGVSNNDLTKMAKTFKKEIHDEISEMAGKTLTSWLPKKCLNCNSLNIHRIWDTKSNSKEIVILDKWICQYCGTKMVLRVNPKNVQNKVKGEMKIPKGSQVIPIQIEELE